MLHNAWSTLLLVFGHNPLAVFRGYELSSLTLLVGVLVATTIRRLSGFNPGGVVATSFIILAAADSPAWAAIILPMAWLVAYLYKRFFSQVFQGRQPGFIMAGLSVLGMATAGAILDHYHLVSMNTLSFPLGIIAPAVLAAAMQKQGVYKTFYFTAMSVGISLACMTAIYQAGQLLQYDFYSLDQLIAERVSLRLEWSALLSFLSVIIGYFAYRRFSIKAAGYIMLPFLATLCIVSPTNFLLLIGLAALTYGIASLIRRYSLLFGISRYTYVIVLATLLAWAAEYTLLHVSRTFSPFMGGGIFAAVAISVLVNEHTLYTVRRTAPVLALSLALMICVEFGGVFVLRQALHKPTYLVTYVVDQPHPKGGLHIIKP